MKIKFLIIFAVVVSACKPQIKPIGNTDVEVFNNTNLYFDVAFKNDSIKKSDSILRLDAGRVLLKKVTLPTYKIQPKVIADVTLTSNGDPWDKSGSLFVVPASADLSFLDLENKTLKKEQFTDSFPGIKTAVIDDKIYQPNIELLRFMTPFGIGFFNEDKRVEALKPVYIPKWEEQVTWQQDITQLLPLLENEVYIGVFIDTWTKEGYNISVNLHFEESTIPNHTKKKQGVIPVVNTAKYAADQKFYDAFSRGNLKIEIPTDKILKNARLYYITTGHGGHAEGDEFTKKENIIKLNDSVIKQFVPWRDDCASFRRFNPTSGVWMEKATWKGEEIEERIASSDYSRSNWCPGSDVKPEVISLGNLEKGTHIFEFAIPEAQALEDDKINYWMVSAYLVYDE
ncbi:PNGase F N-terminal domain-containing protein [Corallibacter vietnamensis]|uniref:PNGase F N-terminal domain-containing protein n=1 Tax=Corallibacter vietnamensis TaxID=904130 RepID=A0ABP7H1U8_9FLAO